MQSGALHPFPRKIKVDERDAKHDTNANKSKIGDSFNINSLFLVGNTKKTCQIGVVIFSGKNNPEKMIF